MADPKTDIVTLKDVSKRVALIFKDACGLIKENNELAHGDVPKYEVPEELIAIGSEYTIKASTVLGQVDLVKPFAQAISIEDGDFCPGRGMTHLDTIVQAINGTALGEKNASRPIIVKTIDGKTSIKAAVAFVNAVTKAYNKGQEERAEQLPLISEISKMKSRSFSQLLMYRIFRR